MKRILITGVHGQIGSELIEELQNQYGTENIIGVDIKERPSPPNGTCEIADVIDKTALQNIIEKFDIDTVFHLASLLSAKGERKPDLAWDVNLIGLKNVLDLARDFGLKIFWPSSIAVFGPNSPKQNTPQATILDPNTMYGITKVCGELLCNYYFEKFAVDVRSVRYPGIISHKTEPGGGTTDYAVEIFLDAVKKKEYECFVGPETRLPMMYMPDAIKASLDIMQTDVSQIKIRTSYNLTAISFSVAELVVEIRRHIPQFKCRYAPDFRQNIANSWPQTIDDSAARQDWHWKHQYDLPTIVEDMLKHLS